MTESDYIYNSCTVLISTAEYQTNTILKSSKILAQKGGKNPTFYISNGINIANSL